ncbi:hypothetical protein BDR26DRAFT_852807, partial [Obelidium mucronatum]
MQKDSSTPASKGVTRPKCSISILMVVAIQTFVVALVVLVVPLLFSVNSTRDSNHVSVQTGKAISASLVEKIQLDASIITAEAVDKYLQFVEDTITNFNLNVQNGLVDPYSVDSVYDQLRVMQQRTRLLDAIFLGLADRTFTIVRTDAIPYRVGLLSNNKTFVNCNLCNLLYPANSTDPMLVKRRTTQNWILRFGVTDFTRPDGIDTTPLDSLALDFAKRPIWIKAVAQDPSNQVVQWADPQLIFNANYTGVTAGLALYTKSKKFIGVFGISLTYMNMAEYVAGYKPTPNSFMFIMTGDGIMLVSSFNETLGNATTSIVKSLVNCTSPALVQISNYFSNLLKPNQTYTSLGPSAHYEIGNMFVQLTVAKRNMIIVNGVLKEDYQGAYDTILSNLEYSLDRKVSEIIGIGVALFVVTMLLGVLFTYLQISRPMYKVASYLKL